MGVSTMFGTGRKQFGIWVFLEIQEINFLGALKLNMSIVYFYLNFFSFYEKVPSVLDHACFLRNNFPHHTPSNPHDIFFTDSYLFIYLYFI